MNILREYRASKLRRFYDEQPHIFSCSGSCPILGFCFAIFGYWTIPLIRSLRKKPPQPQDPNYKKAKKNDWQTLKLWSEKKLITLLYLDESGCCLESPLSYGYSQIGQQKSITQNKNRGRRINIMGVWEDHQNFEYALKVGTYKAKNYVKFMNTQAERAMKRLFETGKYTVIVQDNASIHRANIACIACSYLGKARINFIFSAALFS